MLLASEFSGKLEVVWSAVGSWSAATPDCVKTHCDSYAL
jgi:hypothetical protein